MFVTVSRLSRYIHNLAFKDVEIHHPITTPVLTSHLVDCFGLFQVKFGSVLDFRAALSSAMIK